MLPILFFESMAFLDTAEIKITAVHRGYLLLSAILNDYRYGFRSHAHHIYAHDLSAHDHDDYTVHQD